MGTEECHVGQTTAGLKEGEIGWDKAQQHAVHDGVCKCKDLVDGGIGVSLDVFGGLDDNERLAYRDKARVHGVDVIATLGGDLR